MGKERNYTRSQPSSEGPDDPNFIIKVTKEKPLYATIVVRFLVQGK